jgi:uncharacterized protein (DUF58 family)
MRGLLNALTTRGKTFLAVGALTTLTGLIFSEADLLRIGVLLMLLPALSALTTSRARYRLSCTRQLVPRRIPAGGTAEARVRLSNVSRLRTGLLLAEDLTPNSVSSRQRFVLESIEPGGVRDLSHKVQMDQRGKYTIGPLQVRVADSFGLSAIGRSFSSKSTLVVTPPIVRLPRVSIAGNRLGDGESGLRTVAAAGEDDIAPRAYRDGDELRRVHWRSTARYGQLMVRREEQRWHNRALLLLDTRRRAHVGGNGPGSSFEFAVSAVASIGVHLVGQGIETRLITDTGDAAPAGPAAESLLERLAVVRTSRNTDLASGLAAVRNSGQGQVIAITGALSAEQARQLAASHRGTAPAMALLLDTGNWAHEPTGPYSAGAAGSRAANGSAGSRDGGPTAADVLTAAGWRVLVVSSRTSLVEAWRELHSPAAGGFRRRSTGTEAPVPVSARLNLPDPGAADALAAEAGAAEATTTAAAEETA